MRRLKKILRHCSALTHLCLLLRLHLSLPSLCKCLFGWLLRRLTASLPHVPLRRHVTPRCVASSHLVSSCLTIMSCLVVESRLVSSRRVVSCCIASQCVMLRAHFVRLVVGSSRCISTLCPVITSTCPYCCFIASLHCILSSQCVASRCIVSLPHFVYLIVALLIPAC